MAAASDFSDWQQAQGVGAAVSHAFKSAWSYRSRVAGAPTQFEPFKYMTIGSRGWPGQGFHGGKSILFIHMIKRLQGQHIKCNQYKLQSRGCSKAFVHKESQGSCVSVSKQRMLV